MKFVLIFVLVVVGCQNCDYYYYIDNNNDTICTLNYSCPYEYNKLIFDKNQCTNDCKKDDRYIYEYKNECFEECPSDPETVLFDDSYCIEVCTEEKPYINILTQECVESCNSEDKCIEYNSIKDKIIRRLDDPEEDSETDLEYESEGEGLNPKRDPDFEAANPDSEKPNIIEDDSESYERKFISLNSTKPRIPNKVFENCIKILKDQYSIPNEDDIYFFEIFEGIYEAYSKRDSAIQKLNLSYCEGILEPERTVNIDVTFSHADIECEIRKPFINYKTNECVDICAPEDLFNDNCALNYELDESDQKTNSIEYNKYQELILNFYEDIFTSENYFRSLLYKVDQSEMKFKFGNMIIIFTTPKNEMSKKDKGKETIISLGECENKLKAYYSIKKIYIEKISYKELEKKTSKTEYELYGEVGENGHLTKLREDVCEDNLISLIVPYEYDDKIDKLKNYGDNIFVNSNNDYCSGANSDNFENNALQFIQENINICGSNCLFEEYDSKTKTVICNCGRKAIKPMVSEIKSSFLNLKVLTCNVFKSKDNIIKNIGFYITSSIMVYFIVIVVLFYIKGLNKITSKIDEILEKKFGCAPVTTNVIDQNLNNNGNLIPNGANPVNPVNPPKNHHKSSKPRVKIKSSSTKPKKEKRRHSKKINSLKDSKHSNKGLMRSKSQKTIEDPSNATSVIGQNFNNDMNMNSNMNMYMNNIVMFPPFSYPDTDYELNWLSYEDACKYDQRSCGQYYWILVRTKQVFIFSFFSLRDYDSDILKKYFFFLSFIFHYAFNALFFRVSTSNEGLFDVIYLLPTISYSSNLSKYIIRIMVRNLALTNRNVIEVKNSLDRNCAMIAKEKQIKCIKIKLIIFFVLNFLLLGFFWYFLICFNAVYKKKQMYILEGALISFANSLISPFFSNLLTACFRRCSLNSVDRSNCYCYKFSQIVSLL